MPQCFWEVILQSAVGAFGPAKTQAVHSDQRPAALGAAEGLATQAAREEAAKQRIFGLLPEDQATELMALFDEFEAYETPEAKFAHAMDNVQPMLLKFADATAPAVHEVEAFGPVASVIQSAAAGQMAAARIVQELSA